MYAARIRELQATDDGLCLLVSLWRARSQMDHLGLL